MQRVFSRISTFGVKSYSKKAKLEYVSSPLAPKAVGPYSQAVKANGTMWVSGCLGLVPQVSPGNKFI